MFGFSGVESITKFKLKALKHCLVQPCFILACKTMAAGMQQSVVLYKTWIVMQQKAMQYIKLNKNESSDPINIRTDRHHRSTACRQWRLQTM